MKKYAREDKELNKIIELVNKWRDESNEEGFKKYVANKQEEAKKEANIKTAKSLLNENIPISIIAKATELSESKIMSLK